MGDIADMMLDGTLCEGCGEYLGEGDGFPQYCASCRAGNAFDNAPKTKACKVSCKECGKRVKEAGLADHMRVVHFKEVEE
jgi:hypothetical protein